MRFNSWQDFEFFEKDVKYKNRFVHSPFVVEFLNNIRATLPLRKTILPASSILYRSQLGYREYEQDGEIIVAGYKPDRMKPIPFKSAEGRANPKGISYLYLSSDENTSAAELRPNLGQNLSSAKFRINKDLYLVNCYSVNRHYNHIECIFNPPQSQDEISNAIWSMINNAFTKPVTNNDAASDYVPTQFLAEFFRSEGFDGICCKSGQGDGYNYILFNLDNADMISCTVLETKLIRYDFSEITNPYYIQQERNIL